MRRVVGRAKVPQSCSSTSKLALESAAAAPERENLAGLVERVTFHNEDNGFSVLRVKARGQRGLIDVERNRFSTAGNDR